MTWRARSDAIDGLQRMEGTPMFDVVLQTRWVRAVILRGRVNRLTWCDPESGAVERSTPGTQGDIPGFALRSPPAGGGRGGSGASRSCENCRGGGGSDARRSA